MGKRAMRASPSQGLQPCFAPRVRSICPDSLSTHARRWVNLQYMYGKQYRGSTGRLVSCMCMQSDLGVIRKAELRFGVTCPFMQACKRHAHTSAPFEYGY
jgi:hypothetical protein